MIEINKEQLIKFLEAAKYIEEVKTIDELIKAIKNKVPDNEKIRIGYK